MYIKHQKHMIKWDSDNTEYESGSVGGKYIEVIEMMKELNPSLLA
jgi:hypothetical protein